MINCRKFLVAAIWLPACLLLPGCFSNLAAETSNPPETPEPGFRLSINGKTLTVELADNAAARQQGLSYRNNLPAGHGMLFAYPDSKIRYFTMRETLIPLSIAFIDSQHLIVDIQQMQPFATQHYRSAKPAQFALEVNQGWFVSHGIKLGMQVKGIASD